jgi:L-amino acid N-acyltransferase YncA
VEKKYLASVKVMNSYDYGHFEMTLGSDQPVTMAEANEMRKDAQRLVDNAVRQYKVAKAEANCDLNFAREKFYARVDEIRQKPAADWTVEDRAYMKANADRNWDARYDYDDDQDMFL